MIGATNPFVRLFEAPVETLTAAAYALVLLAALLATWYLLGRNLLTMYSEWQEGWIVLPPLAWALRAVATVLILAVDLLLVAGIIHALTA